MAGLNQWWTDSNPVLPTPPQPNPTLTAVQTVTIGGWMPPTTPNTPTTSLTNIAGLLVNPFKWSLPPNPILTGAGPQVPPMGPQFAAATITTSRILPNATHGTAYTQTLAATGGTAPLTWSVQGPLPAGLTLTSAGVLAGTVANAGGPFKLSITVTDARGVMNWDVFTLTVL